MARVIKNQKEMSDILDHKKRSPYDRRCGVDRRVVYSVDYFESGGVERRRNKKDRRSSNERRTGWARASRWSSVCVQPFREC